MASEDRNRLLLYFAAYVPGGLEAADASFLLRLPIFPGVAHSAESPAWRRLTAADGAAAAAAPAPAPAAAGAAEGGGRSGSDAAVCPQDVLELVCGGWADLPPALQVISLGICNECNQASTLATAALPEVSCRQCSHLHAPISATGPAAAARCRSGSTVPAAVGAAVGCGRPPGTGPPAGMAHPAAGHAAAGAGVC